jgi:hypothetical protein
VGGIWPIIGGSLFYLSINGTRKPGGAASKIHPTTSETALLLFVIHNCDTAIFSSSFYHYSFQFAHLKLLIFMRIQPELPRNKSGKQLSV